MKAYSGTIVLFTTLIAVGAAGEDLRANSPEQSGSFAAARERSPDLQSATDQNLGPLQWPNVTALRHQTRGMRADPSVAEQQTVAPTMSSSPSLVIDNQIHLGGASSVFRYGNPFLWTDGSNLALGMNALSSNLWNSGNSAFGSYAMSWNSTGYYNSAFGASALISNTEGSWNSAFGDFALRRNLYGLRNSAFGSGALLSSETGSYNIAIGDRAGENLEYSTSQVPTSTYSHNIFIANAGAIDDENTIRIGNPIHGRTFIKGIRGTTTGQANALPVLVDGVGQLGTASSSRNAKQDIREIGELSGRLLALRPVAFRFRSHVADDPDTPHEFGLIAEEVAETFPELVVYDDDEQPSMVKYHLLSSLLLNELQKQQRQIRYLEWLVGVMLVTGAALAVGRWRFG